MFLFIWSNVTNVHIWSIISHLSAILAVFCFWKQIRRPLLFRSLWYWSYRYLLITFTFKVIAKQILCLANTHFFVDTGTLRCVPIATESIGVRSITKQIWIPHKISYKKHAPDCCFTKLLTTSKLEPKGPLIPSSSRLACLQACFYITPFCTFFFWIICSSSQ